MRCGFSVFCCANRRLAECDILDGATIAWQRGLADWSPAPSYYLPAVNQYERQPLDLAAHRSALHERSDRGRSDRGIPRTAARARGSKLRQRSTFEDGLTPAEGEVLALFYNAKLRQARLEAGVALANFENAGLWDDPEFGFDGAEILSPSGSPFEFGLTLSLTIPISGRLEVEKARAGAAYEAELRRIVNAEWSIACRCEAGMGVLDGCRGTPSAAPRSDRPDRAHHRDHGSPRGGRRTQSRGGPVVPGRVGRSSCRCRGSSSSTRRDRESTSSD